MRRVAFVSCVKTKSLHLALWWFRMARDYAIQNSDRWFILSASAGLMRPDRMTDPYDLTLNGLGVKLRKNWADLVIAQIKELNLSGVKAIVLAGKNYRQFLMAELLTRFDQADVPMEGLMMGQQLSWLSKRILKKLLLIALTVGVTQAQASTYNYTCQWLLMPLDDFRKQIAPRDKPTSMRSATARPATKSRW